MTTSSKIRRIGIDPNIELNVELKQTYRLSKTQKIFKEIRDYLFKRTDKNKLVYLNEQDILKIEILHNSPLYKVMRFNYGYDRDINNNKVN